MKNKNLTPETMIKVLKTEEHYEHNSTPWHVHIDFCGEANSENIVTIGQCMRTHDLEFEYYLNAIDELIADKIVEVSNEK